MTNPIKILQISDTHNRHNDLTNLPEADVIVHCGDFTEQGTEEETLDFLNWFIELPYKHKIFITGNHDLCLWDAEGIEARPLWKPMHKQPVYKDAPVYTNGVEEDIFKIGMCLPAGPYVTDEDVRYIVECIKEAIVNR